ncbi:hypothetical protein [Gimesia chilikensis]|uniref:hypothetical protein n=1 Tax=Gimesia chilikensis TaxID=2605989 RepID=UPI003A8DE874
MSLEEFFRTGVLGEISLGMSRESVSSLLGSPDLWGPSNAKNVETATIWKYGDIEFYFSRANRLFQIFSDDFEIPTGGKTLHIDPWVIHDKMLADTLKAALDAVEIPYSLCDVPALPGVIEIVTAGNVRAMCRIEREPDDEFQELGLRSFCLSDYSLQS